MLNINKNKKKNSNGNAFADGQIIVKINSNSYYLTTDSNGEAFLDVNLNPGDYKAQIISNCINVIYPPSRRGALDFDEVVKCAIALGKRQFALEVLPATVLDLTLDRSHVFKVEEPQKKKWRLWK